MRLFNFGSLNIDKVYSVRDIAREGETIVASDLETYTGGKGLNQSVSSARAGMDVLHVGCIGKDGDSLKDYLSSCGVDVSGICVSEETDTGHAVIQVDENGRNAIVVYGGANRQLKTEYIDSVLDRAKEGDMVLLQNETNNISYIMEQASEKGLRIAWNPSPFPQDLENYPLSLVDIWFVNEAEGSALAGIQDADSTEIIAALSRKFPYATIVLTLGKDGVISRSEGKITRVSSFPIKVVDTTAAGDTFTGYFLKCYSDGMKIEECLRVSCAASALAVSKKGAAPSIPLMDDVRDFLNSPELL